MGNSCSGNDLKSQSENENENEYIDEELNEIYENEEYNLGNTLSFSEKIFISSTKEKIKQKNFKNEEFKEINDIDICKWYKTKKWNFTTHKCIGFIGWICSYTRYTFVNQHRYVIECNYYNIRWTRRWGCPFDSK